jgi:hypothetical protein
MAVDSKHPEYTKNLPIWERCKDVTGGQDAVHGKGAVYLPKLKDEGDTEYKARKERATFFNATGRTVDGLVGMVTRKSPEIERDDGVAKYFDDIDLQGTHLNSFIEQVLREVIETDRLGVLVEYPQGVSGGTLADVERLNIRPYLTEYAAVDIFNWEYKRVNNVMQLVFAALAETYTVEENREYKVKPQIRHLILTETGYIQQLYRKNDKEQWIQEGDDIIPLMKGKRLSYIPFVIFGSHKNGKPASPMILDLVNLNLAHYRVNADYEHGCHFTGLPTPWVTGHRGQEEGAEKETYGIGSTTAWVFAEENAKVGFLEFTGQGLGALEKNLESKEKQMAVLGARMIEQQKAGVEAAETLQLRSNGESSALANVAKLVSAQLSTVLSHFAEWAGFGAVKAKLNTDYYPVSMTPQQLLALVQSWQARAISQETLFENLKQGEIVSETVTFEEEKERIDSQGPALNGDS